MSDRENRLKTPVFEERDLAAAREELEVLERLSEGVCSQIAELSKRPQFQGTADNVELALHENRYSRLKAYEELSRCSYGRTVKGIEIDEDDRPRGEFTFRITQANVGYPDKGCLVVARNSALASELVTAQPGEERDVATPNRERIFNVSEVRTFDGPVSLLSRSRPTNFASMSLRRTDSKRPVVLEDLRGVIGLPAPERGADLEAQDFLPETINPAWLEDWYGVHLGEAEEQSLGHQFFTRTTTDQERALNNPRGLTFVEGIAGAGKTSVALGRLKYFANFSSGEELERHGLQAASVKDFSPAGMVGFVLSPSLKRYLKDTATALNLDYLPIKDFEEGDVPGLDKGGCPILSASLRGTIP